MGKSIPFTEKDIQLIIESYNICHSSRIVAKQMNCSQGTILRILRKNDIPLYGNMISDKDGEEICRLYQSGLSEEKIGNHLGFCKTTVRKILKANNIEIRSQHETSMRYPIIEDYFENIDTQNKAYILGFFYADGNVGLNKRTVQIALQARDVHILESMKREFGCIERPLIFDKRSYRNSNKQDVYLLTIKNNKMHKDLCRLGVVPQKTKGLTYPNFLEDNMHRHFIRGVMDGDGCIHGTSCKSGRECRAVDICGTYDFCCGTKKIIEKFLDINCMIICTNKRQNSDTYKLVVSGKNQCLKFLNWLYDDAELFLYRKYEIYLSKYRNVT